MSRPPPTVSGIVLSALALPEAEREAYVRAACGEDETLLREVRSLVDSQVPDGFLERPAAALAAAQLSDVPLEPGATIGPFVVEARLGRGAMGEVYRAHDPRLGRAVALKVLPRPFASDPLRRARFEQEARLIATISHPHVASLHGVEHRDGVPVLVLELVEGETLATTLERGALPVGRALTIARQVAAAMEAAHDRQVVHRDLKPSNIVLQASDPLSSAVCVKVLDFGLAKSLRRAAGTDDAEANPLRTAEGWVLGTPAYMSPEQARGLAVDRRTDIWAFGCILFEMLAGRRPFEVAPPAGAAAPDWTALPPQTPAGVRRLLRRCLEPDPGRRLRDIGDALPDLDEAEVPGPLAPSAGSGARRWWWIMALATVAAATVAVWFVIQPGATRAVDADLRLDLDLRAGLPPDALVVETAEVGGVYVAMPSDRAVAISPDGSRLVFVADARLWTRRLSDPVAVPLPGTERAEAFFLGSDGASVAFARGGVLFRLSLAGGSPQILAGGVPPLRGGTWEGDDIVLGASTGGLRQVRNGTTVTLTELRPGEFTHRWPQLLPGGRAVIFTSHVHPGFFRAARIEVLSRDTGRRTVLVERGSFGRVVRTADGRDVLTFVRDGTLFAVEFDLERLEVRGAPLPVLEDVAWTPNLGSAQIAASSTGTLVYRKTVPERLAWIDADGSVRPLDVTQAAPRDPILSPDGGRIALVSNGALWIRDLARGVSTRVAEDVIGHAAWTPDGRHLIVTTADGIASVAAAGTGPLRTLLPRVPGVIRLVASAGVVDGEWLLAILAMPQGGRVGWDLWTAPLRTGDNGPEAGVPVPFLATSGDERDHVISPDGRWVVYINAERGGAHSDVYVRRMPDDGRSWRVSDGGGAAPKWAGDGRHIFFRKADRVLVVDCRPASDGIVVGPARPWSPPSVAVFPLHFSVTPDGRTLLATIQDRDAADRANTQVTLWTRALTARGPR